MKKRKSSYSVPVGFVSIVLIALIATLPFHYVPSRSKVFPKDHLTFNYTFITEEDIENLIKRYNEGSFIEKMSLEEDALVKKLIENGIIVHKSNNDDRSGYRGREEEEKRIADSIRQADSVAMIAAERQRIQDSIDNARKNENSSQNSDASISYKIKEIIEGYYNAAKTKDFSNSVTFFANPVERYFSSYNVNPDNIIKDQERYSQKFEFKSTSVDYSTMKISTNSTWDRFDINYELIIVVQNLKTDIKTKFFESINMKLNSNYKIYYITEKINSKEVLNN